VQITPGMNLQAAVDANPAGTTFVIKAGVHRHQSVRPKNGNTFVGEPGAILSGARVLTGFTRSGSYWMVGGQTQETPPYGSCASTAPRCDRAEDVHINDVRLEHVSSLSQVGPGKFYFDYAADRIYIGQDPTGQRVEASVTATAFEGTASNVTIRGLIVEKYANRAQLGAITAAQGSNWIIESNEVRWNHGLGISGGPGTRVLRNNVHHNGQLGIGSIGANGLIEGNEISYNNLAGYHTDWEGGGTKFAETQDLIVRGNRVHHNLGPGLWTDINNIRTVYENNVVYDNDLAGIFHEISYDAVIRNNVVMGNGRLLSVWLWGAQIQIAGSQNVEVTGNTIQVAAAYGNGIAIIQQNRGTGRYGPWVARNNWVHHNNITYLGNDAMSGAVADWDEAGMLAGNNRFDYNNYHFTGDPNRWYWGDERNLSGMRSLGQERNGTVDTNIVVRTP
jgi:hypothetical protein